MNAHLVFAFPMALVLGATVLACGQSASGFGGSVDGGAKDSGVAADRKATPNLQGPCLAGQIQCDGNTAKTCDGIGGYTSTVDCAASSQTCASDYGCVSCVPYSNVSCSKGVATMCDSKGQGTVTFDCDPTQGEQCSSTGCTGVCSPSSLGPSYIGCDYWPTVTRNGVWSQWFSFAAAVANASSSTANVTVTQGTKAITTIAVAAGSLQVIKLPWMTDLKGPDNDNGGGISAVPTQNVLSKGGSYRLRSDQPVTVYQFNALGYENKGGTASGCPDPSDAVGTPQHCYSYTNDASLLLPTHVLSSNYSVTSYRSSAQNIGAYPGDLVAITATQDATAVTVKTLHHVLGGAGIGPLNPGDTGTAMLNTGDVLQLFGTTGALNDTLSGTTITSNGKPFQLISGTPCTVIPDDNPACDHLEEVVLPLESYGRDYIVATPTNATGKRINTIRLHALTDNTDIDFDPPSVHKPVTGATAGQVVDLVGVTEDFRAYSKSAFGITQYLHGEGNGSGPQAAGSGDPSQSIVVPTQQFRSSYIFLAPADYAQNYLNVVAPAGSTITLDGTAIASSEFEKVGATKLRVARHQLDSRGAHEIHATVPFGISVYGYGNYTSYMYPGGMDVKHISPVPPPK